MGIRIQQLCMSKMSKNGKSLEYFYTKDQVEEGSIWLYIQDMMNLKLFVYQKKNFHNGLEILNDYKASHGLNWHFTVVFQLYIFLFALL